MKKHMKSETRENMKVDIAGEVQKRTMVSLVQEMLVGKYSTSELVDLFHMYAPEKLSAEDLADCLDGVLATATYTIDASRFNKPVVVPAGTGGDGKGTVNITTMAGFVMAASGKCIVPLYGNRKASGKFGKMDVLEALGIQIDGGPEQVRYSLENVGIAPVFARATYPGAKHVAEARVAYGKPTLFNVVMPQAAPVTTDATLLIGSAKEDQLENMARIAKARRVKKALFVHNAENNLDELATGRNKIVVVSDGKIHSFDITLGQGEDIALLQSENPEDFVRLFERTLDPNYDSPQLQAIRKVVALNAACGLFLASEEGADFDETFPRFYDEALALLHSASVKQKLDELRGTQI